MKKINLLVTALLISVILPVAASASWWNTFSWGNWFTKLFNFQQKTIVISTSTVPQIYSYNVTTEDHDQVYLNVVGKNLKDKNLIQYLVNGKVIENICGYLSTDGTKLRTNAYNNPETTGFYDKVNQLRVLNIDCTAGSNVATTGNTSNVINFSVNLKNNNIATTTTKSQTEETIVISSLNGSFTGDSILTTTDISGKKWTVNYKNALFYEENSSANPTIWSADFNNWLKISKLTLTPSYQGPGFPGQIKIVGIENNNIFYASKIIHYAQ